MTHLLVAMAAMLAVSHAAAQGRYPEKPIHLLVGFPAGSTADVRRGREHRHGASRQGGAGRLHGRTRCKRAAYGESQPVQAELRPGEGCCPHFPGLLGNNVLAVSPSVAATTFEQLIALARAQPGALTFASGGGGSSPHIAAELLKSAARLDIRHVPYKGVVAGVPDLLAGRVTMMFAPSTVALPPVRAGKLRALAVTSLKRSPALPDVPTVAESGFPGFEATIWGGLVAPAGTQPSVIGRLHMETVNALRLADVQVRLAEAGLEAIGSTPAEFAALIKAEIPKWAKLISESSIRAD